MGTSHLLSWKRVGGASGLGLSIAKRLSSQGTSVTILDLNGSSAACVSLREVATKGASIAAMTADTTKPLEVIGNTCVLQISGAQTYFEYIQRNFTALLDMTSLH